MRPLLSDRLSGFSPPSSLDVELILPELISPYYSIIISLGLNKKFCVSCNFMKISRVGRSNKKLFLPKFFMTFCTMIHGYFIGNMPKIQFSPKSSITFFESRVFAMGRSSYTKQDYFLFRTYSI